MIKITDLNVVLTDNTGSEVQGTGEMIVSTSPITKEVRDEELNLQNTPNFVISALIPNADVDVTENYNVSFDANEKHYSTVMTVMTKTNLRTGVKVNLQSTGAYNIVEGQPVGPVYSYRFDSPENKTYAVSEDEGMVYVEVKIKRINESDQTETEIYGFPEDYSDTETPDPNYFLRLDTEAEYDLQHDAGGFITAIIFTGNIPYEDNPMLNTIRLYNKNGEELTSEAFYICLENPEQHTLEFDSDNYATSYDIYTGEKSQARVNVLYDGTSIHLESSMFNGLVYNKLEPIATSGGIFKAKDALPEISAGQTYVDNVTVTYEGMIASCTVTLTFTDSASDHVPTKRITCTTSRGDWVIYDSESDSSGEPIEYTDTFDRTFPLSDDPKDNIPWVKTQLKYFVDGVEQNVILQSDGNYPWDDNGSLRLNEEPSEKYTQYSVTGGIGYWDGDNFIEIAPSDTVYRYSKADPNYDWYFDGDATITTLSTPNTSDFSDDNITLTDEVSIYSIPDTMYINGNYDFHIESVGITYDNQNNLLECNSNSDVAFVFKDFGDHSQESNYKAHHINQISFSGINTAAANEIFSKINTDGNGNTVSWVNEEIPNTGRNILTGNISALDTFKLNLTPIIQQAGTITIENIQIAGNIGGAGAGEK